MAFGSRRRALLAACRDGRELRGGIIDAAVLRDCCLDTAGTVDPRGLRLRGVHVRGRLDLAGFDAEFPIAFADCSFDEAPDLTGASVRGLAIVGSPRLPGLIADGLRVRGDLDLSGSRIAGAHPGGGSRVPAAVWLRDAEVGRRLLCVATTIDAGGGRALVADRIRVSGNARLAGGFVATGCVRLMGAGIGGSLELTGARIAAARHDGPNDPGEVALDLGEASIGGSVLLTSYADRGDAGRARIDGQVAAANLGVAGRVVIRGAVLRGPDGQAAVSAQRLAVSGAVSVEGGSRVHGGLDLSYGDLTTVTIGGDCAIDAPGRLALGLLGAEVRSHVTLEPGLTVAGSMRLAGARIHGNLVMSGVTLRSPVPEQGLVSARAVAIEGEVQLRRLTTEGGYLSFRGATIGGTLDATGATLHNPGERTINLQQAVVRNSVRLVDGFSSTGFIALNRCVVEGRLNLRGGRFACPGPSAENPGGHAVQAVGVTVRGGLHLRGARIEPSVDFRNVTVSVLDDEPDEWPERFVVSGMTYERFGDLRWDRAARLRWLARQAEYDAGPYEQLARVFRQHGYTSDAEAILIERRHRERRAARRHPLRPRTALDALYGWAVGYGYRPGRTAWLLLALLIAVSASLYVPGVRDTLRATDPRGNAYAVDGRVVTVDGAGAGPAGADAAPSAQAPRADACGDGQVRCFNPVLYAVDTVVPLISLGQRSTWYASPHAPLGRLAEWWLNLATLAGWVLSTMYVLSFTRFARSV
ncbi:hypothetical protein GCM10022255_019210 [Dactylosporangium darangshiense]|uniref:Membrane-associated oxidoreductase n=1 Tax=Dactylosporangium darangshiense TaxID=579108 RepID=A0ABP8D3X0_9ACTN